MFQYLPKTSLKFLSFSYMLVFTALTLVANSSSVKIAIYFLILARWMSMRVLMCSQFFDGD